MGPRESEVCPRTEFDVTTEKYKIPNTKGEVIDNLCGVVPESYALITSGMGNFGPSTILTLCMDQH